MSVSVIIIRQRRKDSLARLRVTVLRSCSRLAPHKSAAGMNELRWPARQLPSADSSPSALAGHGSLFYFSVIATIEDRLFY